MVKVKLLNHKLTDWQRRIIEMLEQGIEAVLPTKLLDDQIELNRNKLKVGKESFNIKNKRIFVIGLGKSAKKMAAALEQKLGARITAGVVVGVQTQDQLDKIEFIQGGHPLPNAGSLTGAQKILALKQKYKINKQDVVVCLISGGGSSLFALPSPGISLREKQKTFELLIKSGANIKEINCVRKHVSQVKGGRLAQHYGDALFLSLIISDVVGDSLTVIASGPTYYDKTTFRQALGIIEKYGLSRKIPDSVGTYLNKGKKGETKETLKKITPRTHNFLIANNETALRALGAMATKQGFEPIYRIDSIRENIEVEAENLWLDFLKLLEVENEKSSAYIFGGEPTVKIKGSAGLGGRNQELTGRLLEKIMIDLQKNGANSGFYQRKWGLACCGTDGVDFIAQACGGLVDQEAIKRIKQQKIDLNDYLKRHDSYRLLQKLGGVLTTKGATGANVGDIGVLVWR
ncbi:MAG: DUF4147 domain-containing protein [Candidatus Moranbacteria bacterium]|nr:DUF4147 domain-containing protein [Candidatus Moranbacteria bacterium]